MINELRAIRKLRKDRGPRLTARDLLLLRWIGEQYALRFDQAQRLLGAHVKAATQVSWATFSVRDSAHD